MEVSVAVMGTLVKAGPVQVAVKVLVPGATGTSVTSKVESG